MRPSSGIFCRASHPASTWSSWVWGTTATPPPCFPGTRCWRKPTRWVAAVYVAEQDLYRVTLTAPLINQARLVAFLVAGAAKAAVVREVLHGPRDPARLPAQLIQPQPGELLWLTDLAAAAQLPVGFTYLA